MTPDVKLVAVLLSLGVALTMAASTRGPVVPKDPELEEEKRVDDEVRDIFFNVGPLNYLVPLYYRKQADAPVYFVKAYSRGINGSRAPLQVRIRATPGKRPELECLHLRVTESSPIEYFEMPNDDGEN